MENLKKFCVPYSNLRKLRFYSAVVLAVLCVIAYKLIFSAEIEKQTFYMRLIIFIALLVIGVVSYFIIKRSVFDKQAKLFEKRIKTFRLNGVSDLVVYDFRNGTHTLGGNLIIGQDCIIGRNSGMIAFYDEIQRIYQEGANVSNYTQAKEGESSTLCVVCGDTSYPICTISLNEIYNREVTRLCNEINSRNYNFEW